MQRVRFFVIGGLVAVLFPFSLGKSKAPPLAVRGSSAYTIVVGADCLPSERHAAEEFRRFVAEISGAEIPIRSDSEQLSGPLVCIGPSKYLERVGGRIAVAGLGEEGYVIRTSRRGLAIVGGRPRGTLYGVYSFLEDELGCRWFTPDCSRIPKRPTIRLRRLDRRYVPPLEYRDTDYPNARDPDWSARNKMNGHHHNTGPERGGNIRYGPFVHTFNALIPPGEYFDKHPEYFSLVRGKRLKDRTQLCLTNPEVLALAKKRLREWIRRYPDAKIFSVSQNDWGNWCRCDKCSALAEREGSQSGPILAFVNALADDIRRDYPDRAISTLAYTYSRKPPRTIRPRPNVIVRLCSIECCFLHPLATDEFNASFRDDIKGWSKICNRLYIWDYVINYANSIMPFPNLYVLQPNIEFFVRNGVKGIYEEACYFTKGAEFAELRSYILAKTLWDPSYDTDKAIDEFLEGYYGKAAPWIRRYIDLIHRRALEAGEHIRIFSPPTLKYLTPELLDEASALFDRAEGAVGNDYVVLRRVRVARLPILYTRIMLAAKPRNDADRLGRDEALALIDRFEKIARAAGVTRVREGGPLAPLDAWLKYVRGAAAKMPPAGH